MKTRSWSREIVSSTITACVTIAVCVANADAATIKCQRTIAKASSQFVQAKVKALSKCEGSIISGKLPPATVCTTDPETAASITKTSDKLTASIGKGCGGDDGVCGGDLTNEDTPASLGWPSTCPNFEHGNCYNAISDCNGISSCLACVGGAAVDQAIDLSYEDLNLPSIGNAALNKCQTAIGKAAAAFMTSKSKALQKCWVAKLKGKLDPAVTCLDPNPGDGKYLAAIAKAQAKLASTICKACGGADRACGGAADLTPTAIGFAAECPAVTVPGGPACGGAINDLTHIVACLACVNEFKVDCADRLQVPQFATYPPECEVCAAPTPTGPCPTTMELTADGPNVDLDMQQRIGVPGRRAVQPAR